MSNWTIKSLLDWTADFFLKKNILSPRLDAEILLAHILKLKRLDLYLQFDRPLTEQELLDFKTLIKRRSEHEPVAYIVNKKEFFSRDFFVDKNVLIPRPETEELVQHVLNWLKNKKEENILGCEIGLGSGVISLSLLAENNQIHMTGIEVSAEAVEVAIQNAKTFNLDSRLKIICDDVKNFLEKSDRLNSFDFIVSNPPYICTNSILELDKDVRSYEPHLALDGGVDGLNFYRDLALFSKLFLKESGLLAVEIGEDQGLQVKKIFEDNQFKNVVVLKDAAGLDRITLAII